MPRGHGRRHGNPCSNTGGARCCGSTGRARCCSSTGGAICCGTRDCGGLDGDVRLRVVVAALDLAVRAVSSHDLDEDFLIHRGGW